MEQLTPPPSVGSADEFEESWKEASGYFQCRKGCTGLRDWPVGFDKDGIALDSRKGSDGSDGGSPLVSVMRADRDRHFSFPVRNGVISVFGHFQGTENPEWKLWNQENYYLTNHLLV